MELGRFYVRSRGAYTPRIWPIPLLGAPVGGAVGAAFCEHFGLVGVLPAIVVGVFVGATITQLRWTIWRIRHPVRRPGEIMQARRDAAPWN